MGVCTYVGIYAACTYNVTLIKMAEYLTIRDKHETDILNSVYIL
jgi:hypothetical protein